MDSTEGEIERLRSELEALKVAERSRLTKMALDHNKDLMDLQNVYESEISSLKSEIDRLGGGTGGGKSPEVVGLLSRLSDVEKQLEKSNADKQRALDHLKMVEDAQKHAEERLARATSSPRESKLQELQASLEEERRVRASLESDLASASARPHQDVELEKANRDLSRLRLHLVEMEERHTKEALDAETRCKQLEAELLDCAHAQDGLVKAEAEAHAAQEALSARTMECDQAQRALGTLEAVLEEMQNSVDTRIRIETEALVRDKESAQHEVDRLKARVSSLENVERQLAKAREESQQLVKDLSQKTREVLTLRADNNRIKGVMTHLQDVLNSQEEEGSTQIDKRVIGKLIITYFENKGDRKEVLRLMARMLDFSEEEEAKVGLRAKPSHWFRMLGGTPRARDEPSLGDMWMDFLLKEAGEMDGDVQGAEERKEEG